MTNLTNSVVSKNCEETAVTLQNGLQLCKSKFSRFELKSKSIVVKDTICNGLGCDSCNRCVEGAVNDNFEAEYLVEYNGRSGNQELRRIVLAKHVSELGYKVEDIVIVDGKPGIIESGSKCDSPTHDCGNCNGGCYRESKIYYIPWKEVVNTLDGKEVFSFKVEWCEECHSFELHVLKIHPDADGCCYHNCLRCIRML